MLRSLAKAPADRFQSMAAFVAALEAIPQNATRVAVAPTPVVSASAAATEVPPPSHAPTSPLAATAAQAAQAATAAPARPVDQAPVAAAAAMPDSIVTISRVE